MAKEFKAKAKRIEYLTHSVIEIEFEMAEPAAFNYLPGQFIIMHTGENNGKTVKRAYSICSPPLDPKRFVLGIKLIEWGLASHFFIHLKLGGEVIFTGPHGKFIQTDATPKNVVCIATGTGLSTVYSIFAYYLHQGDKRDYKLLWGLRFPEDVYYQKELDSLAKKYPNFSYALTLSKPDAGWKGVKGRVTDLLRQHFPGAEDHAYYVSGNGDMVKEVCAILAEKKVPKANVHTEIFFTPK